MTDGFWHPKPNELYFGPMTIHKSEWPTADKVFQPMASIEQPKPVVYLIGSLRQPERVQMVASRLRDAGFDVFDDWVSAGRDADDHLYAYEKARGHSCKEALRGFAARHIFSLDRYHLDRANIVVLVLPAGRSGHLELGWALGRGKKGFILLDGEPDRIDVMYQFADGICDDVDELVRKLEAL